MTLADLYIMAVVTVSTGINIAVFMQLRQALRYMRDMHHIEKLRNHVHYDTIRY